MGCNKKNANDCANCYRGGVDPGSGKALDTKAPAWYNGKEISEAAQNRRNALNHKRYHEAKKAVQACLELLIG